MDYNTGARLPQAPNTQCQGNRILTRENLEQIVFIPGGLEPFRFEVDLGRLFLLQQIQREMRKTARFSGP